MNICIKKVFIMSLSLASFSASAMQQTRDITASKAEVGRKIAELRRAIRQGSIPAIDAALAAGADIHGEGGTREANNAISEAWAEAPKEKRFAIMDHLLSKGSRIDEVEHLLLSAANDGDVETIRWLLSHGVQDSNHAARDEAIARKDDLPTTAGSERAKFIEIIALLQ